MSVEKKVPEIRFEGFSGEWVEHKLQDLTENGFSNGVFNDPQKVGKGYRLINVKDMYSGDCIDVDGLSLVDIDEKEFKNNKVQYGDIFFTRSSLVKEGIAYSNVNLSDRSDLTFDGHLIRMQPCKATTDPVFLASLFKTSSARKQLILGGKTTTMTTIGQSDIAIVELALPEKQEQTQIGNTFQKLDSLINQHQQKHDKLSNIKKAMLEKMFPKQGETIPEIRFKGFSGEWEEVSLSDFGVATSGTSIESEFTKDGKYKVISIGSYSENSVYTEQGIRASLSPKTESRVLNKNDLTMILNDKTLAGNIIGRVLLIDEDDTYVYNQRTQRIEPFSDYEPQFLYQLLNAPLVRKKIFKASQGNTQIYVNWSAISKLKYLIPKKDEQTAIGNYFQKLDALINQHQQQITKLNNIKQACLSEMFI